MKKQIIFFILLFLLLGIVSLVTHFIKDFKTIYPIWLIALVGVGYVGIDKLEDIAEDISDKL